MASKLSKKVQQMENSRESTLDMWVNMTAELYAEAKKEVQKNERFALISKYLYMVFLFLANACFWRMVFFEMQNLFILPVVLLLLPIVLDIILIIVERCMPTDGINVSSKDIKSNLEKVHSIESNLDRSWRTLSMEQNWDWGWTKWNLKDWDGEIGGRIFCGILSVLTSIVCVLGFRIVSRDTEDPFIFYIMIAIFIGVILFPIFNLILFIYQIIHHIASNVFLLSLKRVQTRISTLSRDYCSYLAAQEQRRREVVVNEEKQCKEKEEQRKKEQQHRKEEKRRKEEEQLKKEVEIAQMLHPESGLNLPNKYRIISGSGFNAYSYVLDNCSASLFSMDSDVQIIENDQRLTYAQKEEAKRELKDMIDSHRRTVLW